MGEIEKVDGGLCGSSGEVICGFPVHSAASVYPLMEGEDWNKTLASIRNDGNDPPFGDATNYK
jgi:hypothetical protein